MTKTTNSGGGGWPMTSDGERPDALAVATALVAAARVTGEDPLGLVSEEQIRRFRFPAFEALRIIYPGMGPRDLGRLVAVSGKPIAQMVSVKATDWWPDEGARATEAALDALEAL